jgi:eukaryotic-like serine/threonine-protein kinase
MAQDAAERLVAGRWMLHTALRRGPAGVIWRATDLASHHSLAVEELHLPSLPDPSGTGTTGGGTAGTWTTGVGSGGGGADGGGSGGSGADGGGPGGGGSGESGLDGAGPGGVGAGGGGTGDLWQRVASEVRTVASLDHPGLVHLDDVVVQDGVVYVATELVDALTLDELIARHGPLPVRRVAQLGMELLDALESAHRAGLAHLDLRPANVLVAADGRARLAGVGLSALRADPLVERATTAFLAPEQVRGDPAGPPADLWALGAILFLAVEGETPFAGDGSKATMAAILSERPRPPELAAQLAPALTALLTKPAGGRPSIPATRRLLEPLTGEGHSDAGHPEAGLPGAGLPGAGLPGAGHPGAGHPGAGHPPDPVPGPPEGEASRWWDSTPLGVHSPPHRRDLAPVGAWYRPRAARNAMDPAVQRVVLIAGGSVLLALVSFAIAVAVIGDPLGLRSQAVASTAATVPPATTPPTTTAAPTTVSPTTLAALIPPGWVVHTDPATGYHVAVPPGWEVDSDGTRTELRDRNSPTLLRIDWQQDPQADPVTLEQLASQAHAGELDDYSQARLEPGQFKGLPAALLEFTFQDDDETWHALELGVRSPRHHVAMAIYARDRDWGAGWALFEVFKASFVPPAG